MKLVDVGILDPRIACNLSQARVKVFQDLNKLRLSFIKVNKILQ